MNVCPICSRSYKRPEHLRRHQQSHSSDRPYVCDACGSTFQRSDVLRRHQQTCQATDEPADYPSKRIALSSAGLAELRRADPTSTFLDTSHAFYVPDEQPEVSFDHIAGWVSAATPGDFWQDFLDLDSGTHTPVAAGRSPSESEGRLEFLGNFTSKTGLIYSFDCGTIEQRQWFMQQPNSASASNSEVTNKNGRAENESNSAITQWLSDSLLLKSHEILVAIQEVVVNKHRQSSITLTWSSSLQIACAAFFSLDNVRRCLDLYWALWHPNVNIIHKPTFDPTTSKAYLVAAMCVIGACVSPVSSDVSAARPWFNCVEEIIFTSDDLCEDSLSTRCRDTGQERWDRAKLRALQAAYIVLLYQNWEGTDTSKRRMRRLRFSMIVAAVRDVGITNAVHLEYTNHDLSTFSWQDFAATEELVRVVLWVFLVDTAFVIFNNLPPRMVITEMIISPAYPEACFQAETAEECFFALQQARAPSKIGPHQRFGPAFEQLYEPSPGDTATQALAELGPLNLFAMASAFHSLVFHFRSSFSCRGSLADLQCALTNWSKVWHLHLQTHPPQVEISTPQDMWKRTGFVRHAEEYWYLAKLMMQKLKNISRARNAEQVSTGEGMLQVAGSPSMTAPTSTQAEDQHQLLRNYDETSMQQINALIADFQKAEI